MLYWLSDIGYAIIVMLYLIMLYWLCCIWFVDIDYVKLVRLYWFCGIGCMLFIRLY